MAHWLQNSSEQKIYLMDMKTQEVKLLGSSAEPKEYTEKGGQWRCDIHSRWSPKGDMIGFNSTKTGERQAYIYRVKE
jgi:Tol biopolymer transport system component